MKELPKELTAELLNLILDEKVIHIDGIKENYLWFYCDNEPNINAINIDTLTRLILEYIERQGYIYNIFNSTSVQGYVMIIDARKYIGKSIFEAVLKATHWVATEKDLI